MKGSWALCGGVLAAVYRETPRFTGDIDIAIIDSVGLTAEEAATEILREMGFSPVSGFVPNPAGGSKQTKALICGRGTNSERFVGIDFLLPIFPWVQTAVERAQTNLIDYGFASIPALTAEDLILAKINALQLPEQRAIDIDDILSILQSKLPIDRTYIRRGARLMSFNIPDWLDLLLNCPPKK
jgi:hypothetical protein